MKPMIKTAISKSNSQLLVSKKHFQKDGKWIVKPSATIVLVCACGNKYIATREKQTTCVRCIVNININVDVKA